MPHPNIIPSVKLNLALPLDIKTRLDLDLWSPIEKRVPKGAYQRLIVSLLREHFERSQQCNLPPR